MNSNLTIKAAVGAALLSAASLPALATSVPASGPTPDPGFGNGGVVVEVWDASTGHSMSVWLGSDLGTFGGPTAVPAGGVTLDYGVLGGSATFTGLFSATDISSGAVQFNVTAVNDNAPASPIVDTTVNALGSTTGGGLGTAASSITTGIESILNGATACNNVNPCTATSATQNTSAQSKLGLSAIGGTTISGTAGGSALDFYQYTGVGSTKPVITPVQFANATGAATWTLSSTGDLVYSAPGTVGAVPLPAAVWLLGSGLLGLAGVARRKSVAA